MALKKLTIYTTRGPLVFIGNDADEVYRYVEGGGAYGTTWTPPISISNGRTMTIQMSQVIAIETEEESQ